MNIRKAVLISAVITLLSACAGSPPEPKQPSGGKLPVNPIGMTMADLEELYGIK